MHAGLEHVVLLSSTSVLFDDADSNPLSLMHRAVERSIEESVLDWTFLRPGFFATNTLRWATIRTERVFRTAFPEGQAQLVHERDGANVAVQALVDETHRRKSYMLLGSQLLSERDQVAAIAEALGEPV